MNRLLIHIGTGKTGTSSIQNFLYENRKKLSEDFSLFYPEYGLTNLNHYGEMIHAHYPVVPWIKGRETKKLEKLFNSIKASGCGISVISCENLYHHLASEDIAFLAEVSKGFSVEIVCYVRRQDLYMESAWKQQVKIGVLHTPFPEFLKQHTQPQFLEKVHDNYYRMLQPWSANFGLEAIKVRAFDKSEWVNEDLIDDFLSTCGLEEGTALATLIRPKVANTALPSELIALVRKVNEMRLVPKNQQQDFVGYLNKIGVFNDVPLLSEADRSAIINNYQESNLALFAEYCKTSVPESFKADSAEEIVNMKSSKMLSIENIAIKGLVGMWNLSSPKNVIRKQSLKKTLSDVYKHGINAKSSYLTKLKNNFFAKGYTPSPIDPNKKNQPSPFVLKLKSAPTKIEDCSGVFSYGFSKISPLKTLILSPLPHCSMTVNDCFVSEAVFKPQEDPNALLGALYENGQLIQAANYRGVVAKQSIDPPAVSQDRVNKSRHIRGTCVYLGWLSTYFGHLLLEAPARFWFLETIDIANSRFIFHPLTGYRGPILQKVYQLELAQALFGCFGIRKEQIILADEDLCVESLIIPSSLFYLSLTVDPDQLTVFNQLKTYILKGSVQTSSGKKIYLSRRVLEKNGGRKADNEEGIEQLFSNYGFEIVFPERDIPFIKESLEHCLCVYGNSNKTKDGDPETESKESSF